MDESRWTRSSTDTWTDGGTISVTTKLQMKNIILVLLLAGWIIELLSYGTTWAGEMMSRTWRRLRRPALADADGEDETAVDEEVGIAEDEAAEDDEDGGGTTLLLATLLEQGKKDVDVANVVVSVLVMTDVTGGDAVFVIVVTYRYLRNDKNDR